MRAIGIARCARSISIGSTLRPTKRIEADRHAHWKRRKGTDRVALQRIWSTEISALSDGPHTEQVEPYDPVPGSKSADPTDRFRRGPIVQIWRAMLFNYSNAGESSHRHGLN
jgi:hypothetical protein